MCKKRMVLLVLLAAVLWPGMSVAQDSINTLMEQFEQQYEALTPQPNSSVNDDYKMGQTALGIRYTNQILSLMHAQNQEMLAKHNKILSKYDEIIKQNKEVIRLLTKIAKKDVKEKE
ncbi:hypothetical protein QUF90_13215 [Desulfococcaceae bacterium HSG9]|nr:hypothetical protein [Desulfococcaceae bacterium HSG9]